MRPLQDLATVRGFTLIELLVAMFLMAIIGSSGFTMLQQMNTAYTRIDAQSERLRDLDRTFYYLTEDINQLVKRPVRTALDAETPPLFKNLTGSSLLELTRGGWSNPAEEVSPTRSSLQRVSWVLEDDKLYRSYWYHLDSVNEEALRRRRMLDGVEAVQMRFLDADDEWQDDWPPVEAGSIDGAAAPASLPRAVEFNFDLEQFGRIRRVFAVPG